MKNLCERCGKDKKWLVSRQGFIMAYFIEFVCEKCFKELEGVDWESYSAEHYYSKDIPLLTKTRDQL